MEEKKTLFEILNENVDKFEEREREKRRKAEEELREEIEQYIQRQMLKASNQGGYRCKFNEGDKVDESDIHLTIKDVADFVEKNPRLEKEFYGNDAVEVIWRKGRSEFYEEPLEELPLPEEESTDEPSEEPENGEDDDETVEDSEYEYAYNRGV